MAKKVAPSADELAERSEHQQGPHLDPADRDHFWHKPDEAPAPAPAACEPHWLHKRADDGSITDSVHVTDEAAHQAAIDQGFA